MKVDFFRTNEQNAPTVEHFLFSKEISQVMNGEFIEQNGQYYQVTGQTIPDTEVMPDDDPDEWHPMPPPIVFVYPVPRRPIEVQV